MTKGNLFLGYEIKHFKSDEHNSPYLNYEGEIPTIITLNL